MRRTYLPIAATIIAAFGISMFAFQAITIEAGNIVSPSATPSPRKIRKAPVPIKSPITKVKAKKPAYREGGVNDTTYRTRKITNKTNKRWYNLPEVDDEVLRKRRTTKSSKNEVTIETLERRKQPRRKRSN